jgi:hypothetical protein
MDMVKNLLMGMMLVMAGSAPAMETATGEMKIFEIGTRTIGNTFAVCVAMNNEKPILVDNINKLEKVVEDIIGALRKQPVVYHNDEQMGGKKAMRIINVPDYSLRRLICGIHNLAAKKGVMPFLEEHRKFGQVSNESMVKIGTEGIPYACGDIKKSSNFLSDVLVMFERKNALDHKDCLEHYRTVFDDIKQGWKDITGGCTLIVFEKTLSKQEYRLLDNIIKFFNAEKCITLRKSAGKMVLDFDTENKEKVEKLLEGFFE